jgi:hypothetical protein
MLAQPKRKKSFPVYFFQKNKKYFFIYFLQFSKTFGFNKKAKNFAFYSLRAFLQAFSSIPENILE